MPITISFELSDGDIEHFVAMGREAWLADTRAALHSRMRDRRRSRASSGSWRVRLW